MQKQVIEGYRLSPQQRHLWKQQADSALPYRVQLALLIEGKLDEQALKESLQRIVDRHEIYRTSFRSIPGVSLPLQVINDSARVSVRKLDLASLGSGEQEIALEDLFREARFEPFDLENGPLFRVSLVRLSPARHVLVVGTPAACADLKSVNNLSREILRTYVANKTGEDVTGEPLQYCGLSEWQNELLELEETEIGRAYWRRFDFSELLEVDLPLPSHHQPQSTFKPESVRIEITDHLASKIGEWAKINQLSVSSLLLACWEVVLWKMTASEQLLVGVAFDGRTDPELEDSLGLLTRFLPLSSSIDAHLPLRELAARLDQSANELQHWQEYFSWELLKSSDTGGYLRFLFESQPPALEEEAAGVRMKVIRRWACTQRYKLKLECEVAQTVALELSYDEAEVTATEAEMIARRYRKVLEQAVSGRPVTVGEIEVVSDAERRLLVEEWNDTTREIEDTSVQDQIAEMAATHPEQIAVEAGDLRLSYQQLNERANRLAHYLSSKGVGPEVVVGVMLDRNIELVVALLAILEAGGAYLPLDPDYPQQRLRFMLADSQARLVITDSSYSSLFDSSAVELILMDQDREQINAHSDQEVTSGVSGDNLAYIIYTSGSTGVPKGVMIPHCGLANYLSWCSEEYRVAEGRGTLVHSPIGFDLTITSLFSPLMVGQRAVLVSDDEGIEGLASRLRAGADFSLLKLTPSHLTALSQLVQGEINECARAFIIGGEALTSETTSLWMALSPGTRLINEYGPTETVVGCCVYEIPAEGITTGAIPIGRPIANTQLYILDAFMHPAGVSITGEIYIGGEGVARGYLNRPDLTAEQFLPDPFSSTPGKRLYRTGDQGRYLSDGNIEYLGRIDQQVKIRGFRIELGEIESVVAAHPAIREAVVLARSDLHGHNNLVAYIVGANGTPPEFNELREYLSERLPYYMLPSGVVTLDSFPLTSNGKINRKALPEPGASHSRISSDYQTPRNAVEETLTRIWSEALGVERVGINDNFFELGGDSIISIQIVARAGQSGFKFIPRQIFQHPTIAELAQVVNTQASTKIARGIVTGPVPLTPIQQWFFDRKLDNPNHFNQAVMFEVKEPLDPSLLEKVVQELTLHHDALRLRFIETASGWQQINTEPKPTTFVSAIDLSHLPEAELARSFRSAIAAMQASLNITYGPTLRVALFNVGDQRPNRLIFIVHHLAVDGLSWRILIEDLQTAYQQLKNKTSIELPNKTTSFKEWAERLTSHAASQQIQRQADYWLAELERPVDPLPRDYPRGVNSESSTSVVQASFSEDDTRALLQQVPRAYRTQINDVLLAALVKTYAGWTKGSPLLFDLEGHGREDLFDDVDLSRTVGWHTTQFPVVLEVSDSFDERDTLRYVKEHVRQIPDKGIGYGLLRYMGVDDEIAGRLRNCPQAEISFNYFGQFDQVLSDSSPLTPAKESTGPVRSPDSIRPHLIEITGSISGGKLHMTWIYSRNVHERRTIEELSDSFLRDLRSLILHCSTAVGVSYTPSDFPECRLSQQALDELVAEVESADRLEDIYPLSPLQQGILFHSVYAPEEQVYFRQLLCIIEGDIKPKALRQAWTELIRRHSILRTGFIWNHIDRPLQIVLLQADLDWEEQDWQQLNDGEQQSQLEAFLERDKDRGFDLAAPPLMRVALMKLDETHYQLVWTVHHIIVDGWSASLIFKEVLALYASFHRGARPDLPRVSPYREYISWLQRQDIEQAEAYWRQSLKGFVAPTPLPIPRAALTTPENQPVYAEHRLLLSEEETERVKVGAREARVTVNTIVAGAWAVLLARYSQVEEVVYGVTVAGRPAELEGVERMVGLFINTLAVRAKVEWEKEVGEWLEEQQQQQAEMRQYEYSPLMKVQGWSEIGSGEALFDTLFVYENYPVEEAVKEEAGAGAGGGMRVKEVRISESTNYGVTVIVGPGRRMSLRVSYDESRYESEALSRMIRQLKVVLLELAQSRTSKLKQVSMLSEAERRQIVYEWNETQRDYETDKSLVEKFEEVARRWPEKIAVASGGEELSYQQLNRRANQLGRYLRGRGVRAERAVGIMMERGLEMVVGMLGILKAGGAYVPLDPEYPQQRVQYMVEDAGAGVVITDRKSRELIGALEAEIVEIEEKREEIGRESGEDIGSEAGGRNLAYIIYTSGSTGQPKGVAIEHCSAVTFINWCMEQFTSEEMAGVLASTSICFDLSVFELFATLSMGGKVIVAKNALQLPELPNRNEITLINTVPSAAAALVSMNAIPASVQVINLAGEPFTFDLARKLYEVESVKALFNLYGPSEDTTYSTVALIDRESNRPPDIGIPIANTQVYLLDKEMQPVPIGIPGELYLGGQGLARGYKGRGDLTAERFIPDPFSSISGARLYRTGDLARFLPSGQIDFLGRIDHQVKIRGFRIELQEVEAALLAHPLISDAAVISVKTDYLNNRLAAFFVAAEASLAAAELRGFLSDRLPHYMIPASFTLLDQLPLTPNGKLDRTRLAALAIEPEPAAIFTPARTEAEVLLAEIWQGALHLDRVGITDNFFALGGDSIISIQIVARARRAGLVITPRQMFQHQTIAELARVAERVGQTQSADAGAEQVAGEAALTPIQEWFFEQEIEQRSHFNQSVMLRLERKVDAQVMKQVVDNLLVHHDALRLSFRREGQRWRQRISAVDELPAVMVYIDLEGLERGQQREAVRVAGEALQQSLDLECGPVLRVGLMKLGAGSYRLLIVIHHLAVDAVSWRILMEDLERWYEQLSQGEQAEVWEKTTSYLHWAERLDELARSAAMAQEVGYWEREIGAKGGEIVADFDRGPLIETAAGEVKVRLGSERTRELLREAGASYQTRVEDLLVSAFVVALQRWRAQSEVVIELEGHGRDEEVAGVDVTRTVGWFTRMHPVRLGAPEREQEPGELIKGVKEKLRRAARRGLSFGLLRYKSPDRVVRERMKQVDRAEVLFNYLGQLDRAVQQGSQLERAEEASGRARTGSWRKRYLLEINSAVTNGRLELSLTYSRNKHHRASIQELGQRYLEALEELISHCVQTRGGHTPSDFELAELRQAEIDELERDEALEQVWELTPMQQGILYHSLKEEGSGVYHNQVSWRLEGVEVAGLKQAWREVVARHSILRSSVQWEREGAPLAVVRKRAEVEWEEEDRRELSVAEQAARQAEYLRQDRERGVDIRRGPLMRMGLGRVGERAYDYTWSSHHLIVDGWSSALLIREVMRRYREIVVGAERSREEGVARGYEEYVRWLRRQDLEKAERYWRAELSGLKHRTRLSVERIGEGAGRQREIYEQLSEEETEHVKVGAREARVTVNTIVAGAWAVLLARYSQMEEVVYGVTVAGRPAELEGVERMVGLFINTLAVRVQVAWDTEVGQWLAEQQQKQAEMREYEYSSLMKVQGWSEVGSGEPLFDTLLVYENYPVEEAVREEAGAGAGANGGGVRVKEVQVSESTNYGVTVIVAPGRRMSLRVSYDESRYESEALNRMIRQLKVVLLELAQSRTSKLKQVSMLSEAERRQIVFEWNETYREYETDQSLIEKFEEVARRWPEKIAVASGGEEISYQELNRRVNQLGRYLQRRGVRAERAVGIMMERGLEMVVGMLGILKAGGAYVPLDPEYPQQRVQYMVEDAGAGVVITDRKSQELIGALEAEIVEIEEKREEIGRESAEDIGREAGGRNLAYIIYTSGSTGRPKGVAIEHRSVINLLCSMADDTQFKPEDVLLSVTTLSFDIAGLEIYLPLLTGAKLIVAGGEESKDPARLCEWLDSGTITMMQATPSMWRMVVDWGWKGERPVKVLCGGEALPKDLAQAIDSRAERMWNVYGPSETTIWSTMWEVRAGEDVRIGRGIANTTLYILGARGEEASIGQWGELYIGGEGVARGYVGRAELTADRFVPDPYSKQGGARLYRTGDVCRFREGGEIEYQRRVDQQVKVRGYRIELGEIETALRSHPEIAEAVATIAVDGKQNNLIAAYYVSRNKQEVDDLRSYLESRLPEFMIPAAFIQLEAIPLTPNKKIDRKALPGVKFHQSESVELSQAPRNEVEEVLALIWAGVFGLDQVGVHNSFFELGGYSLLAILITARVREAFKIELPLRSIFDAPTVAALARVIVEKQRGAATSQPTIIKPVPRVGPMPLSFEQDHLWKIEQADPGREFYIVSTALMLAAIDVDLLKVALREVFKRHESLRTRFDVIDGNTAQIISDSTEFDLDLVDLSHLPEESQDAETLRLALEDATRPFDTRERLFRATLLHHNEEFHVALLAMHMLIGDGFSMNLLLRELTATYEALENGRPTPLTDLTIQYADYTSWQRDYLQNGLLESEIGFWKERLRDAHSSDLPSDLPRSAQPSYQGDSMPLVFSKELTDGLKALGRQEGASLYMVVMAALHALLYHWTGETDTIIGAPGGARIRPEYEDIVGLFGQTLPIRADLSGEPSFRRLLKQTRERVLEAHAHQEVPMGKVIAELFPDRSLNHSPLFQVALVVGAGDPTGKHLASRRDILNVNTGVAKYDLTIQLRDLGNGLVGKAVYRADLYNAATISHLLESFEATLQAINRNPDEKITNLSRVGQLENT